MRLDGIGGDVPDQLAPSKRLPAHQVECWEPSHVYGTGVLFSNGSRHQCLQLLLGHLFLLTIRQGWSGEKISKQTEPIMHIVLFGFAWGTGVSGLGLSFFNPKGCQMLDRAGSSWLHRKLQSPSTRVTNKPQSLSTRR
jgi:hypothetical protein